MGDIPVKSLGIRGWHIGVRCTPVVGEIDIVRGTPQAGECIGQAACGRPIQKEEGPWSSLYVGIMGNYGDPVLRIMTDSFKMNITSAK